MTVTYFCPYCGTQATFSDNDLFAPWCGKHASGHMLAKRYDPFTGEAWFPCAECGKARDESLPDYLCHDCRKKADE